ncbi:putative odorant receptor 59c [Drosophila gunungcola]|uniref:putative odorant receptor 59c n=1 Tax=Drosophila gunungcola TaxID=103775 RepID=UPI0022E89FB0|nr:putative odorant receptor 59c [Drosophila gunungcola]
MKKPLFERLQAAPVDQPASSVDASDYYYRITFLLGLKPPKEGLARWIYFLWSATVMWLGIVYLPLGLTLTYVLHFDRFTPTEFLSSLQVDINCIGNVVKSLVTFSQMWRLRRMNELIAPLDARCDTPSQRQILHNVVARVNLIVFIFVSMYLGFGFLNVFTSVLVGKTPWQLYNPFLEWQNGYWQLWIASILEYFVVSIATMQELISDAYPIVFVSLFRGHLAVLKNRIENLRQDPELSEEENYRQLVACIQDHRTIVESAQVIRPILSVTIFAQFMLVGIDLGLAAISILYFPSTIWTIMANVSFILAVCLESFPCCMLCEHLIDDCAHVSDALFHSNWISAEKRYKSTVIYFLHRVQQPIEFTAGSIFPISVQSNIAVAKFAFTIITIVNQMNLGEKFFNNRANAKPDL